MKFLLSSVGKEDQVPLKEGIEDYTRRIGYYYPVDWKIIAPPKTKTAISEKELKTKEATLILQNIKKDDYLVALDEKGTMLSSVKLASMIQHKANESVKQMVFLIGGAFGLDGSVLDRANFTWSLSPLTFPHQLVRLILTEQIYRACTILRNEKYHHG